MNMSLNNGDGYAEGDRAAAAFLISETANLELIHLSLVSIREEMALGTVIDGSLVDDIEARLAVFERKTADPA